MSFLTRRPGILVVDHLTGHSERVHHNVSASPPTGFTGRKIRVTSKAIVEDIVTTATNSLYVTAEIATAITAN